MSQIIETNLSPNIYLYKSKKLYKILFKKDKNRIEKLEKIDPYFIPNSYRMHPKEPYIEVLSVKIYGKIMNNVIYPFHSELNKEVVHSSFVRWVNGYGSHFEKYLKDDDSVVCCDYSTRYNYLFPLSGLTKQQQEEYKEILYDNWDEIVKPLFIEWRETLSNLQNRVLKVFTFPCHLISELDLCNLDSKFLDNYPKYNSIERYIPMACGNFISSFVFYPSREQVLLIALKFLSKKSITQIYNSLMDLTDELEECTIEEKIRRGLALYQLFSNTERNREIYFKSFLNLDGEDIDFLIDEEETYSQETIKLIQTFSKIAPIKTKSKAIVFPNNKVILGKPFYFYEGLVCGAPLENSDIISDHYSEPRPTFQNFINWNMRCYNPSDCIYEDENLYCRAMEKIFILSYIGKSF